MKNKVMALGLVATLCFFNFASIAVNAEGDGNSVSTNYAMGAIVDSDMDIEMEEMSSGNEAVEISS